MTCGGGTYCNQKAIGESCDIAGDEGTCNSNCECETGPTCIPDTCSDLGYECGTWDDGCGGTVDCGSCSSGETCQNGQCVAQQGQISSFTCDQTELQPGDSTTCTVEFSNPSGIDQAELLVNSASADTAGNVRQQHTFTLTFNQFQNNGNSVDVTITGYFTIGHLTTGVQTNNQLTVRAEDNNGNELDSESVSIDFVQAAAQCGNGVVEAGEECDGQDLGGQTCADFGCTGGNLACDNNCQIDTSGCTGCGGGECNPGDTQDCYTGPTGTEGVGICEAGTRTCQQDGTWGDCQDQTLPEDDETCDDGEDDDCDGQVDEGCGLNQPDLTVDISSTPSSPAVGKSFIVELTYQNQGDADAQSVQTRDEISDDPDGACECTITQSLIGMDYPAGESKTKKYTCTCNQKATLTVQAEIDIGDEINESNEDNNDQATYINVEKKKMEQKEKECESNVDCRPEAYCCVPRIAEKEGCAEWTCQYTAGQIDFTWSPLNPKVGEQVQFDGIKKDCAWGDTAHSKWFYTPEGGTRKSFAENDLDPTHAFDEAGTYTIRYARWCRSWIFKNTYGSEYVEKSLTVSEAVGLEAKFTWSPRNPDPGEEVFFDAQSSTGDIDHLTWDFGDGSSTVKGKVSEVNVVRHTYSDPGDYDVKLTAVSGSDSKTATHTVHISDEPSCEISVEPKQPDLDEAINVEIKYRNMEKAGSKYFRVDCGNNQVTNIGPCTGIDDSCSEDAQCSYSSPGRHRVSGYLPGSPSVTCTPADVLVGQPETAPEGRIQNAFTIPDETPEKGEELEFDASQSKPPKGRQIKEYHWDFGDGTQKTGAKVTHSYTQSGTYTVYSTVVDNEGSGTVKISRVRVTEPGEIVTETVNTGEYTLATLSPGWNSIYVTAEADIDLDPIKMACANLIVYRIGDSGLEEVTDQLKPGESYLVRVDTSCLLTSTVKKRPAPEELLLQSGWNLAIPGKDIDLGNLEVLCTNPVVFRLSSSGMLRPVEDKLQSGGSYLIRVDSTCSVPY